VLATVASSVVAAIVVVIAMRHLPVARPFLRKFVALLLLMTMLGGGFYYFATMSHEKEIYSSLFMSLNQENQQNPAT
jgi:multisubunit Na+/H+ antiporter MnhB subunit